MLVKAVVITVMFIILFNLGRGLFFLLKNHSRPQAMVKALSWRIGISMGLFILLFIGFAIGIIHPHTIL